MTTDEDLTDIWAAFQAEHECSVDRMLCSPDLRRQFLADVRAIEPNASEEPTLRRLLRLRKAQRLPTLRT